MNIKILTTIATLIMPTAAFSETILTIVDGRDEVVKTYTLDELDALEQTSYETTNAFIDERSLFSGPLVRTVLGDAQLEVEPGSSLEMKAVNDYAVTVPVDDIREYDVILATRRDGTIMSVREKGPIWVMYPISDHEELTDEIYNSRLIWQLKTLKVMY